MSKTLRKIAYDILIAKDNNLKDQIDKIESIDVRNSWEVEVSGEELSVRYVGWKDEITHYEEEYTFEVDGLPYVEEYDEGESFTGDQLRALLAKEPDLVANIDNAKRDNVGKIVELNKQIAALINEMTELAEEANLEVTIDLGQHGSLDVNSDWDSSRC